VFIPLTAPLAALVGVGSLMRWRNDVFSRLVELLRWPLLLSIGLGLGLAMLLQPFSWAAFVAMTLVVWISLTAGYGIKLRIEHKPDKLKALGDISLSIWAMLVAHFGIAIFIVGISLTSIYSEEKDIKLAPGESLSMAGYDFLFHGVKRTAGVNYDANQGQVTITKNGELVADLFPQKRVYRAQGMPMTEAGIDAGLTRDLFFALGEPLGENGAWALRVYYKPFVRWIWVGGLIMAFGGLLAVLDKRYRKSPKPVKVSKEKSFKRS
jgi:cytochrome c-type biogenesis protein CcmF